MRGISKEERVRLLAPAVSHADGNGGLERETLRDADVHHRSKTRYTRAAAAISVLVAVVVGAAVAVAGGRGGDMKNVVLGALTAAAEGRGRTPTASLGSARGMAATLGSSRDLPQTPVFVHIPNNGGTSIELLAAYHGARLGMCAASGVHQFAPNHGYETVPGVQCNVWHRPPLPPPAVAAAPTGDSPAAAKQGAVGGDFGKLKGSFCLSRNPFDRLTSQYRFKAGVYPEKFAPTCDAFSRFLAHHLDKLEQNALVRCLTKGTRHPGECQDHVRARLEGAARLSPREVERAVTYGDEDCHLLPQTLYTRACERVFKLEEYDASVAPHLERVFGLPRGGASSTAHALLSPSSALSSYSSSSSSSSSSVFSTSSSSSSSSLPSSFSFSSRLREAALDDAGDAGDLGRAVAGRRGRGVLRVAEAEKEKNVVDAEPCSWSRVDADTVARVKSAYAADFAELGYDVDAPPAGALDLGGGVGSNAARKAARAAAALGQEEAEQEEGVVDDGAAAGAGADGATGEEAGVLRGAASAWKRQHPEEVEALEREADAEAERLERDEAARVTADAEVSLEETVRRAGLAAAEAAARRARESARDERRPEAEEEEQEEAEEAEEEEEEEKQGDAPAPAPVVAEDEDAAALVLVSEEEEAEQSEQSEEVVVEAVAGAGAEEEDYASAPDPVAEADAPGSLALADAPSAGTFEAEETHPELAPGPSPGVPPQEDSEAAAEAAIAPEARRPAADDQFSHQPLGVREAAEEAEAEAAAAEEEEEEEEEDEATAQFAENPEELQAPPHHRSAAEELEEVAREVGSSYRSAMDADFSARMASMNAATQANMAAAALEQKHAKLEKFAAGGVIAPRAETAEDASALDELGRANPAAADVAEGEGGGEGEAEEQGDAKMTEEDRTAEAPEAAEAPEMPEAAVQLAELGEGPCGDGGHEPCAYERQRLRRDARRGYPRDKSPAAAAAAATSAVGAMIRRAGRVGGGGGGGVGHAQMHHMERIAARRVAQGGRKVGAEGGGGSGVGHAQMDQMEMDQMDQTDQSDQSERDHMDQMDQIERIAARRATRRGDRRRAREEEGIRRLAAAHEHCTEPLGSASSTGESGLADVIKAHLREMHVRHVRMQTSARVAAAAEAEMVNAHTKAAAAAAAGAGAAL